MTTSGQPQLRCWACSSWVSYRAFQSCDFDGLLFFANASNFRERVRSFVDRDPTIKMVLLDGESITDIDTTALEILEKLKNGLFRSGIDLPFARMKMHLRDFLCNNGLTKTISSEHFYTSVFAGFDIYYYGDPTVSFKYLYTQ